MKGDFRVSVSAASSVVCKLRVGGRVARPETPQGCLAAREIDPGGRNVRETPLVFAGPTVGLA